MRQYDDEEHRFTSMVKDHSVVSLYTTLSNNIHNDVESKNWRVSMYCTSRQKEDGCDLKQITISK